jgi:hypothetical protein
VEAEASRRQAVEEELRNIRALEQMRHSRIRFRARQYARVISWGVFQVLVGLLLVGTVSTFPWGWPKIEDDLVRYGLFVVQLLFLTASIAGLVNGVTVRTTVRLLEVWLSRRIEGWLLALGGEEV